MHFVISVNYSHLVVPMSPEAGQLVALLEKAVICKENGYGSMSTYTQTEDPINISLINSNRLIVNPSKEFSALEDLSKMASRAFEAESERDKVKKELEDLKLKFAPFMLQEAEKKDA